MCLPRLICALSALFLLVALAACDAKDMADAPHPMGNFKMNANFIDAKKLKLFPYRATQRPRNGRLS